MSVEAFIKQLQGPQGRRFFLVLLLLSLFYGKPAYSQSFPYKFNYLTVDEGLSHTDANGIAQDNKGYIWIATYFGLDRYDGYSIKQYYNNNQPINNAFKNRIWSIYPDETGNIWLETEAGIQCFDSRTEKYLDFIDVKNKSNLTFYKLLKPAGNLLFALGDRLVVYLVKGNRLFEQPLKAPKNVSFTDMISDENGNVYLSSNKGIWVAENTDAYKKYVSPVLLPRSSREFT